MHFSQNVKLRSVKKNGKKICSQNDTINCKKSIIIGKGEFVGEDSLWTLVET